MLDSELFNNQKSITKLGSFSAEPVTALNSLLSSRPKEEKIQSARERSKIAFLNLWEKVFDLKHTLLRSHTNKDMPILPSRLHIKKVIECLDLMSKYIDYFEPTYILTFRDESDLKELMVAVMQVLKTAIFISPKLAQDFERDIHFIECDELSNECFKTYLYFIL